MKKNWKAMKTYQNLWKATKNNEKLRKYMATNGYKLVTTNYKITNEAEGIQAVYDKVLEGRNQ